MNKKYWLFVLVLVMNVHILLVAQSHTAVPLGDSVYYVLEQAQMRGLCAFLPGAKPYSREKILSVISEILANDSGRRFGQLTETERRILEQFRQSYGPGKMGLDWQRGAYNFANTSDKIHLSGELGVGFDFLFGAGYETGEGDRALAADTEVNFYFKGDLGLNASYGFSLAGGVFKVPRNRLGQYNTYYDGFSRPGSPDPNDTSYQNRVINTYSEPLSFFPYTFKKHWDGFVFDIHNISNSGHLAWPNGISIGYMMMGEFAGTFLDGHVFYRVARLDREWGAMTNNGSLILNQTAQPFLGAELTVTPFSWLSFSSLAGGLEYDMGDPNDSIKRSASVFQNAFSVNLLEVNIKDYVQLEAGSSAIWPKRFELGYLFPLLDKFLYQDNVGDFDNMALFGSLQGQIPGLGKLWFSLFLDEANPEGNFFELDRMMYAYQVGTSVQIPWLPFTSAKISYTKVEPYTYTHTREYVPWYGRGDARMVTAYINNGKSLGSYLPPNSDEILVRLESMPTVQSVVSLQYQLIRHGADHGTNAVDGSSLYSELDPSGRSNTPELKKFFLHDGAYEWMHIIKLGGEFSLTSFNVPVKLFGEFGCVYSYYTNINGTANDGSSHSYSKVDTAEYPTTFRIIGTLGVKIFPK